MSEQNINWLQVPYNESGELFANTFMNFVNSSSSTSNKEAIEKMMSSHRTLQQYAFDFCLYYIEQLSTTEVYDIRNTNAVETSRKIVKTLGQ